nr:hypothetical protein [Phomopsis vexans fusarivirus 1]
MSTHSKSTTHTDLTEGRFLSNHLKALEKKQVTFKNESGFFMTIKELEELEGRIASLAEKQQTSIGPDGIIALNDSLALMTKRAQEAELKLKAVTASLEKKTVSLEDAKANLEAVQLNATIEKQKIDEERKKLNQQLKGLQDRKKIMHHEVVSPEAAKSVVDQISHLQKELAVLNAARKEQQTEVNQAFAQVEKLKASLAKERAENDRLRSQTIAVPAHEPPPLEDLDIDVEETFGATLKKVFSSETLSKIKDAAAQRQKSTRQYAFELLKLSEKTDPKAHIGYTAYIGALFNKIKVTPSAERKAKFMKPLDDLFKSMAFQDGAKLNAIKREYKELFGNDKEAQAKTKTKVRDGKYTFWDGLKHDLIRAKKKFFKPTTWWKKFKFFIWDKPSTLVSWWFADKN